MRTTYIIINTCVPIIEIIRFINYEGTNIVKIQAFLLCKIVN